MKTAISTALWGPDDNPYMRFLGRFAASLENQSTSGFDVHFSVSENLAGPITETFRQHAAGIKPGERLFLHSAPLPHNNLKMAHHRFGVVTGMKKYDSVLLIDPDDSIPSDYVSRMTAALESGADIAIANPHIVNGGGVKEAKPYFNGRFKPGDTVLHSDILHFNIAAWSNTAVRSHILDFPGLATADPVLCPAGDWLMFFPAIARGARAVVADAGVFYEQHAGNLSHFTHGDDKAIARAVQVKWAFYMAQARISALPRNVKEKIYPLAQEFDGMKQRFFPQGGGVPSGEDFARYTGAAKKWRGQDPANGFGWWGLTPPESALKRLELL